MPAHPSTGLSQRGKTTRSNQVGPFGMSDNAALSNMASLSQVLQKAASPMPVWLPSLALDIT